MNVLGRNTSKILKERRQELRFSQAKIHQLMGWKSKNCQYISNLELGKQQIPAKHVNKISKELMINREKLIEAMCLDYRESLIRELNK